jgi:hypothetical protein
VVNNGFGSGYQWGIGLAVHEGKFYAMMGSSGNGMGIWVTTDGINWNPIMAGGFGDTNNNKIWATTIFQDKLLFGTENYGTGGEVWQMVFKKLYLPFTIR